MDLPTLWPQAEHWSAGRFERGYVRREPSAASVYCEQFGLVGPFGGRARRLPGSVCGGTAPERSQIPLERFGESKFSGVANVLGTAQPVAV